ncbi:hypothetical protein AB0J35_11120 [Nonomuraea angiospora]|uniref:hypothetical protein n=1 Tax=Nonomuraea angiospora TaxID=46172 RepID=UPI00343F276B
MKLQNYSFLAQVVGPHFEALCRDYAPDAGESVFGQLPAEIGAGVVPDPVDTGQVDVVALAAQEPGKPRRILSLGEARWGEVMDRP